MRFTFTDRAVCLGAALSLVSFSAGGQVESPDPSLTLEGVVVSPVPSLSVALLRSPSGRWARAVRVGESYLGMRLVEVSETSVVLEKEGRRLQLALKGEPPGVTAPQVRVAEQGGGSAEEADSSGAPTESPRCVERELDRAQAEARLQRELPVLLAETRITPRVNQGEVRGYRITNLPAGTLLAEVGLSAGDVLLSVDDLPIEKLASSSYPELLGKPSIRVLLEREGERLELVYHFR